jgi:AcrR family transcriptional regulator
MFGVTTAPGRRERRKLADRERLMAAARQAIAEEGTDGLRINDLTATADIGFGTFYSHFESKDAMIEAVVSEAISEAATVIGRRALESDDPAEAAAIAYRSFVRLAVENPDLAGVLVRLGHADEIFETALLPYARETLARGVRSGRFRLDDPELALTSVSAAALAAIRAVLAGRVAPEAERFGAEMWLRAFGVPADEAAEIARRELPSSGPGLGDGGVGGSDP